MRTEEIIGSGRRAGASPLVFLLLGLKSLAAGAQPAAEPPVVDSFAGYPRVTIISDIGNEPDDQMSFVRLLLYSNELDLEVMIASTSTWRANLQLHAKGWATGEDFDERIFAGQPAYGIAATGHGKASAGSQALVRSSWVDYYRLARQIGIGAVTRRPLPHPRKNLGYEPGLAGIGVSRTEYPSSP